MYINDTVKINENLNYLYHGSKIKIEYLQPRKANGVGPEKDKFNAVYASHIRNTAIAFALPITPDHNGNRSISISFTDDWIPKITIKAGNFDNTGEGYLYKLPIDTFEKIDDWQWVSFIVVKPFDFEIIYAKDYEHWINYNIGV
jgi:hypothetical protein